MEDKVAKVSMVLIFLGLGSGRDRVMISLPDSHDMSNCDNMQGVALNMSKLFRP